MSDQYEHVPLLQEVDIDDEEEKDDILDSIVYAIYSFNAVLKPISITMILASLGTFSCTSPPFFSFFFKLDAS